MTGGRPREADPREAPTIAGAFFAYGAIFFDRFAPLYVVAMIAADLGVPSAAEGTVALLIGVGWALAMPTARLASGRWSDRRRVLAAAAGAALFGAASAAAPGWLTLVALRGLGGICAGTAAPAITSLAFAAAPARRRGLDIGVVQSSTRLLGSLASPAMVTAVALAWGWRAALVASAVVVVAGALILAGLVRPQPPPSRDAGSRAAEPLSFLPGGRRNMALSAVGCVVLLFWITTFSQSAVPLVQQWLEVEADMAGRVVSAFGVGAGAAALLVPLASDRVGRRAALATAALLGGAGGLGLSLAAVLDLRAAPWAAAGLVLLGGVAMGGLPLVISIVPAEGVATGDVGRALAMPIASAELVGGAALPAVAAVAAAQVGAAVVLGVAGACVLALLAVSAALAPLEPSAVDNDEPG